MTFETGALGNYKTSRFCMVVNFYHCLRDVFMGMYQFFFFYNVKKMHSTEKKGNRGRGRTRMVIKLDELSMQFVE